MDFDSYAPFIAVDVDLETPLFRFGLVGGTQYADMEDARVGAPQRNFRHSLDILKRAVEFWRSRHPVAFVVHLGDVLAAESVDSGSHWAGLESFDAVRHRLGTAWHFTPSPVDVHCFGAHGLCAALKPARDTRSDRNYYAFFPAARWRVCVLDCCDPDGPAEHGGGPGPVQMQWLSAQLSVAASAGEYVIVLTHRAVFDGCENAVPNADEIRHRLAEHPGVVACVIFMGDGQGFYMRDAHGIHHLAPLSAVERDVNDDAYGVIDVFEDRLRVEMVGSLPAPSRLASGWPCELVLPRSGQLTAAADSGVAGILQMFLFLVSTLMVPFQPLLRLVASQQESSSVGASPSDAEGTDDPASSNNTNNRHDDSDRQQHDEAGDSGSDNGEPGVLV